MAPRRTSEPTTAPPRAILIIAPIPVPPPELTSEEIERWNRLHQFRNTVDAIRAHLQPPGTQTPHLRTLTRLYYNQHIAGPGEQYTNDFSLNSRFSKDKRTEERLHLATIGARLGTTEHENRALWNEYLRELGLPQVQRVGTGLPDHLRCRDSWAARVLASMPNTAAVPAVVAPAVAEMAEAGPSTAASRATARRFETPSRAGQEEAATRLASVQEAMRGATEENDEDLFLALQYRRASIPRRPHESDDEAMTRLAVQFISSEPFATARDALIELVRAGWDVEVALNSWSPDQAEELDRDDEDLPPSKWQRLSNDDDDGEEGHGGQGKGKGKQRAG